MIKNIVKFFLYGMAFFSSIAFGRTTMPMTGDPVPQFTHLQTDIVYFMRKHQVPGASVAIMHNGKLLYARGLGYANTATREQVQPNSLFRIASISKAITAAAVIQLIQEHKIDFDTKIFSVLDDLKPRPGMRRNSRIDKITVADVLRMLSGWDGDQYIGFDPIFGPWPKSYARRLGAPSTPPRCELAAEFMMGMPLQSMPGTHYSYANINYCLLGLLINKVIGQPYGYQAYQQHVQTSLLEPMGITDMRIGSTTDTLPNEVHYYGETNNHQFPYGDDDILHKAYSAGGWLATATDLVKFENGLMHMLNKRSIGYIEQRPPGMRYKLIGGFYPVHYGMGWFITKLYSGTSWVTHGSFTGTRSVLVKRPDGYVIAVIFNREPMPQGAALRKITYLLLHEKLV